MARWLGMVDIDRTLAKPAGLSIHPGQRAEWEKRLAQPIRPIAMARQLMPEVADLADIAIVSGRPDYVEPQTTKWLRRHFHMTPIGTHLCPVGTDPIEFKSSVCAKYRSKYRQRICAIDDVRYPGPAHFFLAPQQWPQLLAHLREVRDV